MDAQRDWDDLADVDPLWAVLSAPGKRGGRWRQDEFFATGEAEIAHVLTVAQELRRPARTELALDFGCGVGRATRALANRFTRALGLDVSPQMIELARKLNPNGEFAVHEPPRIPLGDRAADLVYSHLVLQHLASRDEVDHYLREFLRVARPDGLVVFQLPDELPWRDRIQPRRRLYAAGRTIGVPARWLYEATHLHPVSMLAVPEPEVRATLEAAGATVSRTERPDPTGGATGLRYYVHHHSA